MAASRLVWRARSQRAKRVMPRMGIAIAAIIEAVVAGRPYLTMTALDAALAKSFTVAQRKALYPKLFLEVNLNTATDAEFNLIPGMGPKMLKEFNEYRPYASLAVWRKEIGKYVGAKEAGRLWRYVVIQ